MKRMLLLLGPLLLYFGCASDDGVHGQQAGDSSPIEVAGGSYHLHNRGGVALDGSSTYATVSEGNYVALAFKEKGCAMDSCLVQIKDGWSGDVYDATGNKLDTLKSSASAPHTVVDQSNGNPFMSESKDIYGPGVKHNFTGKVGYVMITPTLGGTAQRLPSSGYYEKFEVVYCDLVTTPPNHWACK